VQVSSQNRSIPSLNQQKTYRYNIVSGNTKNMNMRYIKLFTAFIFILSISCSKKPENTKPENNTTEKTDIAIVQENVSVENLAKEIKYEGKLKEITKVKDLDGEHIIILTETGEIPSRDTIDFEDATDFRIFAYDYLLDKADNKFKRNWIVQDNISDCTFDLMMGFIKNTFKVTDLNHNGIAEIWLMYSMTCTSDVSPSEMKIIMHEGKQKYALRGNSIVNTGTEKIGGDYKLDENFKNAPTEFKDYVLKMWQENNEEK
jgi:hypothetical protein